MSIVKETVLDNLSERAQEFIADLKEKLELDSEEEVIIYINNILSTACKKAGISADEALQNISEVWKHQYRLNMLAQGFTYYRFGVMTNEWEMWAKDQKLAHMTMVVFISQRSAGMFPIVVYEPEDDDGPPFKVEALAEYVGGDLEKYFKENKVAIQEVIKTIKRTKG